MKSLRKSLNGNKDTPRLQISTPLPLPAVSKPPSAILPPQKVIRALNPHRSQAPQELSFQKGDFFYVISDGEDRGQWYEAHNPVTGARGLVPRDMFEEFSKNTPTRTSQLGLKGPISNSRAAPSLVTPKSQVFYAIVQHDFQAERPDELDAKRGDAITVVAQSNREWLVAKPIGRLGRPGLIPVSFVEIHDPSTGKPITDVEALMDRGELPKVEDWKKAMLSYKQSSIPLGVLEHTNKGPVNDSSFNPQPISPVQNAPSYHPFSTQAPPRPPTPELLPEGLLLNADVVSFHYEMEEYWFRIDALYQPYQQPGDSQLPPARQLILFRVYNDFYDFQVSLLDAFPREGGRHPPHPRILPFMPGPAEDVDDALTATRRMELDTYIHGLCDLPSCGARYILEHQIVREFLSLKPGDVENEVEPRAQELAALLDADINTLHDDSTVMDDSYDREIMNKMGGLRVGDERSEGLDYGEERYSQSPVPPQESELRPRSRTQRQTPIENGARELVYSQTHGRTDSSSSFHSRSHSPYADRNHSPQPSRSGIDTQPQLRYDSGHHNNGPKASASSFRSSQSTSSRARSHSNAASNLNNPPISAANPQTAFVKIKIFDRVADDLIAIRVHPKVTHTELMEKVQARLGGEVTILRYRDSITNAFVGLEGDVDLRAWMEGTDKHVLYAD
ncbi:Protein scd2/ral3 [Leucoagaricus sp. SymC.cos]|nr:Protein scd2/ral3 [Leucoagaricus sp. SymC.cos]